MNNLKIMLSFLFTIFLFTQIIYAQENKDSKVIRFAFPAHVEPYVFKEKNHVQGLFVDIMEYILHEKMGLTLIHNVYPWARAQESVKTKFDNAHVTSPTEARKKYMFSSKYSIVKMDHAIFYSKYNPKVKEIESISKKEDIQKFIIGDYIGNGFVGENFPKNEYTFQESVTRESALLKTAASRVDVFLSTSMAPIKFIIEKNKIKNLEFMPINFIKNKPDDGYFFVLRKDFPNAENIVKEFDMYFIKLINSKEMNNIYKRWNVDK